MVDDWKGAAKAKMFESDNRRIVNLGIVGEPHSFSVTEAGTLSILGISDLRNIGFLRVGSLIGLVVRRATRNRSAAGKPRSDERQPVGWPYMLRKPLSNSW